MKRQNDELIKLRESLESKNVSELRLQVKQQCVVVVANVDYNVVAVVINVLAVVFAGVVALVDVTNVFAGVAAFVVAAHAVAVLLLSNFVVVVVAAFVSVFAIAVTANSK